MCFEEQSTPELLTELTEELERRKQLLTATGQPNIDRYNEATGENLTRYIFACDEVAEMLDKTGLTKDQKETVGKIESRRQDPRLRPGQIHHPGRNGVPGILVR